MTTPDWGQLFFDSAKGPWFSSGFTGGEAACCGETIVMGETIRADGEGTYEHKSCVETAQREIG